MIVYAREPMSWAYPNRPLPRAIGYKDPIRGNGIHNQLR